LKAKEHKAVIILPPSFPRRGGKGKEREGKEKRKRFGFICTL